MMVMTASEDTVYAILSMALISGFRAHSSLRTVLQTHLISCACCAAVTKPDPEMRWTSPEVRWLLAVTKDSLEDLKVAMLMTSQRCRSCTSGHDHPPVGRGCVSEPSKVLHLPPHAVVRRFLHFSWKGSKPATCRGGLDRVKAPRAQCNACTCRSSGT